LGQYLRDKVPSHLGRCLGFSKDWYHQMGSGQTRPDLRYAVRQEVTRRISVLTSSEATREMSVPKKSSKWFSVKLFLDRRRVRLVTHRRKTFLAEFTSAAPSPRQSPPFYRK
jgi:hypothetical protein